MHLGSCFLIKAQLMSIFVGFRSGSSWLLFICTVIIVQLMGKAIRFGTSFFLHVCVRESIYVLEEYN